MTLCKGFFDLTWLSFKKKIVRKIFELVLKNEILFKNKCFKFLNSLKFKLFLSRHLVFDIQYYKPFLYFFWEKH